MRVFAIRDDEIAGKDLGYLLYYEGSKAFYIELPEEADEWETPMILSSFVRRGEHSVNAYWSMVWVRQRIVPQDRQNLGQILKDNGLDAYDELQLLLLGHGRCAQDNVYITEVDDIPISMKARWQYKIEDAVPLADQCLLVFFRDGSARRISIKTMTQDKPEFAPVLSHERIFNNVMIQPDGYGVAWSGSCTIADHELYNSGETVPLTLKDMQRFVSQRIVNAAEAQEMLHCSRQNIADLVKRGKLHPIRTDGNNRLFMKTEIQQRMDNK